MSEVRQATEAIRISKVTRARLIGLMRPQESYNDVIVRLLDRLAPRIGEASRQERSGAWARPP